MVEMRYYAFVSKDTARRLLVKSIGRLIDIAGATANIPAHDPVEATAEDWRQVGDDLRTAMKDARRELTDEQRDQLELVEAR